MSDPLVKYHATTGTLEVTVTDQDGDPVTTATVTVTIVDRSGTELTTDQDAPHDSGGVYKYTIPADLLPTAGQTYVAQVTSVNGAVQSYAERSIHNKLDRT